MTKKKPNSIFLVLRSGQIEYSSVGFPFAEKWAKDKSDQDGCEIYIVEAVNCWLVAPPEEPASEVYKQELNSLLDL